MAPSNAFGVVHVFAWGVLRRMTSPRILGDRVDTRQLLRCASLLRLELGRPSLAERVDTESHLALAVEVLRRTIDLRDALAAAGSDETSQALILNDVVNAIYELAVSERARERAEMSRMARVRTLCRPSTVQAY